MIRGSGNIITELREVSNFNQVNCSIGKLNVTQGDRESLTITTEDNIMPFIITEVKGGTLYIRPKENTSFTTEELKYDLQIKDINKLKLSGSVKVRTGTINTDGLQIEGSGSNQIDIDSLIANELQVNINGSGKLDLSGKVTKQRLKFSGSSKYNAANLESQTIIINISGAGEGTVWVKNSLDVKISGAAKVNYYGSPQVKQNISGAGKLNSLS